MQKIVVKIPRRKQKIRIIRTDELINKELKNRSLWHEEEEIIATPEVDNDIIEEIEPELPVSVRTVFTETFVITDSNQPIEISLKNIPLEESLPVSEVMVEVQSAYDKGFNDGQESSIAAYQSEISKYKEWIKRIDNLTRNLKKKFLIEVESLEKSLIPISIMIAEKIISSEISVNGEVVINQVKNALQSIGDEQIHKITLNPDDIDILKEVKSDLVSDPSKIKNVEITGDASIERGFCVLSTGAGIIDAKLSTQLTKMSKALKEVMSQPMVKQGIMTEKEANLGDLYADLYDDNQISG